MTCTHPMTTTGFDGANVVVHCDDCGYEWSYQGRVPSSPAPEGTGETVLQEAQRLVDGPRGAVYDHPFDDFSRTAGMWSALFAHKLREPFEPREVALAMVCLKLSREEHKPRHDNRVDMAGYSYCEQLVLEREGRA